MAVRGLIVDDSPIARRVIRQHLMKGGIMVVGEAENAQQALKLFRELRPQVVTLDVMMPEVGGVDSRAAFQTMKNEDPDVAIVLVSALPFEKTRETFLREGALAYIVKPFTQYSFEPVRQRLARVFPELSGWASAHDR